MGSDNNCARFRPWLSINNALIYHDVNCILSSDATRTFHAKIANKFGCHLAQHVIGNLIHNMLQCKKFSDIWDKRDKLQTATLASWFLLRFIQFQKIRSGAVHGLRHTGLGWNASSENFAHDYSTVDGLNHKPASSVIRFVFHSVPSPKKKKCNWKIEWEAESARWMWEWNRLMCVCLLLHSVVFQMLAQRFFFFIIVVSHGQVMQVGERMVFLLSFPFLELDF